MHSCIRTYTKKTLIVHHVCALVIPPRIAIYLSIAGAHDTFCTGKRRRRRVHTSTSMLTLTRFADWEVCAKNKNSYASFGAQTEKGFKIEHFSHPRLVNWRIFWCSIFLHLLRLMYVRAAHKGEQHQTRAEAIYNFDRNDWCSSPR